MIQRLLVGMVMTFCLAGCASQSGQYDRPVVRGDDNIIPRDQLTYDCDTTEDERERYPFDFAGAHRIAAGLTKVPDLAVDHPTGHIYRFTWQRSFDHPVVMTLFLFEDGSGKLEVRGWQQITVYRTPPAVLNFEDDIMLSAVDVFSFLVILEEEAYWQQANFSCKPPGMDGSTWTVEGMYDGKYHYVSRWSPRDGPVRTIGETFIALSGVGFGRVY